MSAQKLYDLLPAIHRLRDAQEGRVLEALLEVAQGQAERIAENLEELEDDWFIETCRDWLVPYLGELVSARSHYAFGEGALSLRAFVADTLNFRRRKGTASMLEDMALALSGYPCRAVELFSRVATTQHHNHVRPSAVATIGVRRSAALERLGGPFDGSLRTVDVRNIAHGEVRPNLPNIALFLFRLRALEAVDTTAVEDLAAGPGRFRFDPLGADRVIFNPARTLDDRALDVTESDVPAPARRRPLYDELSQARAAIEAGRTPRYHYFAAGQEVLTVTPAGESEPIPPEQIQICNLDDWSTLPTPITVTRPDASSFETRVAIDPTSGRLAFLDASVPAALRVTFHYGAAAAVGALHYPREHAGAADATVAVTDWSAGVSPGLSDALVAWAADGSPDRTIEIVDSGRYDVPASLEVPAGRRLTLRARGGQRPLLELETSWPVTIGAGATLVLDGLMLLGGTVVAEADAEGGADAALELRNATLVPGLGQDETGAVASPGSIVLRSASTSTGTLRTVIEHSVVGRLDLTQGTAGFGSEVHISDSVIDDASDPAEALRAHELHIARSTVLGAVAARTLEASDTIFTHEIKIERTQQGCARFCYLPQGSKAPRSYRCQPALALAPEGANSAVILARLRPSFTTTHFGDGAYVQLDASCPREIREGGSDGGEMGAHFQLHQPQREANLRSGLEEYLRFGLEAGLVFVT